MGVPRGYLWLEPDCVSANLALSHPLMLTLWVSLLHAPPPQGKLGLVHGLLIRGY